MFRKPTFHLALIAFLTSHVYGSLAINGYSNQAYKSKTTVIYSFTWDEFKESCRILEENDPSYSLYKSFLGYRKLLLGQFGLAQKSINDTTTLSLKTSMKLQCYSAVPQSDYFHSFFKQLEGSLLEKIPNAEGMQPVLYQIDRMCVLRLTGFKSQYKGKRWNVRFLAHIKKRNKYLAVLYSPQSVEKEEYFSSPPPSLMSEFNDYICHFKTAWGGN